MGKELKTQGKSSLIPTSAFKRCHECEKPFNIFRLKYRCDKCSFCYCKHHLKSIKSSDDKSCTLCDLCLETLNAYKTVRNDIHPDISESDSGHEESSDINSLIDSSRRLSEQEPDANIKVYNFLQEIQGGQFHYFNSSIKVFVASLCTEWCTKENIEESWIEILCDVAEEASKTVCPSVAHREDSMNINKYVKIVKNTQNQISCKFYKASVIEKNFAYKRISSVIDNCRVLLIKGSTWFYLDHKKIMSITDVINLEKKYIENLFAIISSSNPNIVILEKTMPQALVKKLETLGIGVLMSIPLKRMQHISRITQGKILKSLVQGNEIKETLGTCKKYFQIQHGKRFLSVFSDEKNSVFAGTIIICHPSKEHLLKLSHTLKKLLQLYRNTLIERNFFWLCNIFNKENIFRALHQDYLNCKFISVYQNTICQYPRVLNIKYCSEDDMPLGKHLVSAYMSFYTLCDVCEKHEIGDHAYYYINNTGRVKFSLEKDHEKKSYDIVMKTECRECSMPTGSSVYINQSGWEYSFHKFIGNFFTKSQVSYANFSCTHDALKLGKFIFSSQGLKANFEWEENQKFNLLPLNVDYPSDIIRNIIRKKFDSMVESVKQLLDKIKSSHNNIFKGFFHYNTDPETFLYKIASSIQEKIDGLYSEVSLYEISPLETFFSLEAYRKYYFSNCCLLILRLEELNSILDAKKPIDSALSPVFCQNNLSISLIDNVIEDKQGLFNTCEYISLQTGQINLFKELQQKNIAVYETDTSSIIAYSLCSFEYYEEVITPLNNSMDMEENLEYELFNGENYKFTFKDSLYDIESYNSHCFKPELHKVFGPFFKFTVKNYFAKHFYCLISTVCGNFQDFVQSLSKSQSNPLHRLIRVSQDTRYLIKIVSENTFKTFLDLAPNYFRHECKVMFHKMPSKLLRIFGAYKVSVKSLGKTRKEWILIQENLGSMLPDYVQTYRINPTSKKEIDPKYLKDFQGIPITLPLDHKKILDASIWNDSLFFSKQNIINYSLLIKANFEENLISVGISDYLDQYTFEKVIESKYKVALGNEANNPIIYKELFRTKVMQGYFMVDD
jgi:TCP-1/cpn60 chaperonin family/Phosphatidylinositol-4-phosphate 5-Kinase